MQLARTDCSNQRQAQCRSKGSSLCLCETKRYGTTQLKQLRLGFAACCEAWLCLAVESRIRNWSGYRLPDDRSWRSNEGIARRRKTSLRHGKAMPHNSWQSRGKILQRQQAEVGLLLSEEINEALRRFPGSCKFTSQFIPFKGFPEICAPIEETSCVSLLLRLDSRYLTA